MPAARSVPTRRATAAWKKLRERPSRMHTKSAVATVGAKAVREGVEGGGECGGGGGWLSGLSATAHEVPLDVESGSANRGVPGE